MAASESAAIIRFRSSVAAALDSSDKVAFDHATRALAVATRTPLPDVLSLPAVQSDPQLSQFLTLATDLHWLQPRPTWASILKRSHSIPSPTDPTTFAATLRASSLLHTSNHPSPLSQHTTTPKSISSSSSSPLLPQHHGFQNNHNLSSSSSFSSRSLAATASVMGTAENLSTLSNLPALNLSSIANPSAALTSLPTSALGAGVTTTLPNLSSSSTAPASHHTTATISTATDSATATNQNPTHWVQPPNTPQRAFIPPLPTQPVSLPFAMSKTTGGSLRPSFRSWKWFASGWSSNRAFIPDHRTATATTTAAATTTAPSLWGDVPSVAASLALDALGDLGQLSRHVDNGTGGLGVSLGPGDGSVTGTVGSSFLEDRLMDEDVLSTLRLTPDVRPAGVTVAAAYRALTPFLSTAQRRTLRDGIAYAEPLAALHMIVNAVHEACGRARTGIAKLADKVTTDGTAACSHNSTNLINSSSGIANINSQLSSTNFGALLEGNNTTNTTNHNLNMTGSTAARTPAAMATANSLNDIWMGSGFSTSATTTTPSLNGAPQQQHGGIPNSISMNGLAFDSDRRWGGTVWAADGRDVEWKPLGGTRSATIHDLSEELVGATTLDGLSAPFALAGKQNGGNDRSE